MVTQQTTINAQRLGANHRTNDGRYVEVEGIGWFVHIRCQSTETDEYNLSTNMIGPYQSYLNAVHGFVNYIYQQTEQQKH